MAPEIRHGRPHRRVSQQSVWYSDEEKILITSLYLKYLMM